MSAHAARIKRLEDIANSVPRVAASELTDADIAKLLLNEAKRGKLETILPTPSTWSRPDVVNKQYLLSTIRSIESHNRREEINDCWRQRDLLDLTIRRHKSDDKRPFRESDGSEREVWAQRKMQRMNEKYSPSSIIEDNSNLDDLPSSILSQPKKKRIKKDKKKREEESKRKKHKKSKSEH